MTVVGTERRRSLYEMNEIRLLSLEGVRWDGTADGWACPGAGVGGTEDCILAEVLKLENGGLPLLLK